MLNVVRELRNLCSSSLFCHLGSPWVKVGNTERERERQEGVDERRETGEREKER